MFNVYNKLRSIDCVCTQSLEHYSEVIDETPSQPQDDCTQSDCLANIVEMMGLGSWGNEKWNRKRN